MLLGDNTWADIKLLEQVEEGLLRCLQNRLLALHTSALELVLEIELVGREEYTAHIAQ